MELGEFIVWVSTDANRTSVTVIFLASEVEVAF
jgi:hypothetical protein